MRLQAFREFPYLLRVLARTAWPPDFVGAELSLAVDEGLGLRNVIIEWLGRIGQAVHVSCVLVFAVGVLHECLFLWWLPNGVVFGNTDMDVIFGLM